MPCRQCFSIRERQNEHDSRLHAVLKRLLKAAEVTLNKENCQFSHIKIAFLGYVNEFHLTLTKQKLFKR